MAPEPGICEEKKRLQEELGRAIVQLSELQNLQMQDAHGNDPASDERIVTARQIKKAAKIALIQHLEQHGCWADELEYPPYPPKVATGRR